MRTHKLTIHDAAAGILVAAAVALVVLWHDGMRLAFMESPRMLGGAVLLLGATACAVGGAPDVYTERGVLRPFVAALTEIGAATMIVAIVAIMIGSQFLVSVVTGLTVLLWIGATVRHALRRPLSEPAKSGSAAERERIPTGV